VRKKQGGHSLPTAQPHQAEVMARELEIVCHRAVETAPLAELRRANTNPAAVAQFVDRVEYVDDIETDFESSFLRDLDSARQADVECLVWMVLRENDLDDIAHSAVAVFYSDLFLTERSFAELLNRSAVQTVIAPTNCRVVSNVSDALAAVAELVTN